MARYALVRRSDGHVVNVINWDGTSRWSPPEGHDTLPGDSAAEPGARWDGARFHRAPPTLDRTALITQAIDLDARLGAARRLAAVVPDAQTEVDRLATQLDEIKAQLGAPGAGVP